MKLPNGKYGIYSDVIDNYVLLNATEEEVIEFRIQALIEQSKFSMKLEFQKTRNMSDNEVNDLWNENLNMIEKIHGIDAVKRIKKSLW